MSAHIVVDSGYLRKKGKLNKRDSGSSPSININLISYTKPMVTRNSSNNNKMFNQYNIKKDLRHHIFYIVAC